MGKGPGRKNQKGKNLPDYAVFSNPKAEEARRLIARSGAAGPHTYQSASRATRKKQAIRDQFSR